MYVCVCTIFCVINHTKFNHIEHDVKSISSIVLISEERANIVLIYHYL